jgi:hypothetical protein
MNANRRFLSRVTRWTLVACLTLGAAGCVNPFSPRLAPIRGVSSPPPIPNQDIEVIRLFAWCWNNRAYQEYSEIFTEDFRFQFSLRDTAGSLGRGDFLTRSQELDVARHLFVEGNATEPPASSIELTIDPTLISANDSRIGKNGKWHREIYTSVVLHIKTDQDFQVTGHARFFVTRGDSAQIPEELKIQFPPDTTRWWIERWEDETDEGASSADVPRDETTGSSATRSASWAAAARGGIGGTQVASPNGAQGVPIAITWTRLQLGWLGR